LSTQHNAPFKLQLRTIINLSPSSPKSELDRRGYSPLTIMSAEEFGLIILSMCDVLYPPFHAIRDDQKTWNGH
jgi:hypothetical protein